MKELEKILNPKTIFVGGFTTIIIIFLFSSMMNALEESASSNDTAKIIKERGEQDIDNILLLGLVGGIGTSILLISWLIRQIREGS